MKPPEKETGSISANEDEQANERRNKMRIDPLDRVSEEIERQYNAARAHGGQELADKMYPGIGRLLARQREADGRPPFPKVREPVGVPLPLISRGHR